MSDLSIPARLVAEGVGLPPVWLDTNGCWREGTPWDVSEFSVNLTNPQTAFGLALKLDEWEWSGPAHNGSHIQWTERVFRCQWRKLPDSTRAAVLADMAERLTRIALDEQGKEMTND